MGNITHCLPLFNTLFANILKTTSNTTHVDGRSLYTNTLVLLAQTKLKVLYTRILLSQDWQRLCVEYKLSMRLDCRDSTSTTILHVYTATTTTTTTHTNSTGDNVTDLVDTGIDSLVSISVHVGTGQFICQYKYPPQTNTSPHDSDIYYADSYTLFENEIDNIASIQYYYAYLSNEVVKEKVDYICNATSLYTHHVSHMHTTGESETTSFGEEEVRLGQYNTIYDSRYSPASNGKGQNYDRVVYLKPIVTFANVIINAAFAEWTVQQKVLTQYPLEHYAELYPSLISTIQTSENLHFLSGIGSVYLLESWDVYDTHGKRHLDRYEKLFPMSLVDYSDFIGGNLSSSFLLLSTSGVSGVSSVSGGKAAAAVGGSKRKGVKRLFNENDEYMPKRRALAAVPTATTTESSTSATTPATSSSKATSDTADKNKVLGLSEGTLGSLGQSNVRRGLFLVLTIGNTTGFPPYVAAIVATYHPPYPSPTTLGASPKSQTYTHQVTPVKAPIEIITILSHHTLPLTYTHLTDLALSDCITQVRQWKSAHLAPNYLPIQVLLQSCADIAGVTSINSSNSPQEVEDKKCVYIQLITATSFTIWSDTTNTTTSTTTNVDADQNSTTYSTGTVPGLSFLSYFDPTRILHKYLTLHKNKTTSSHSYTTTAIIGSIVKVPLSVVEPLISLPAVYRGTLLLPTITPTKAFDLIFTDLSSDHPSLTHTTSATATTAHNSSGNGTVTSDSNIYTLKSQFTAVSSLLLQASLNHYYTNYFETLPPPHHPPRGRSFWNILEALHYLEGDMVNIRILINFLYLVYTSNIEALNEVEKEEVAKGRLGRVRSISGGGEKKARLRYIHADLSTPYTTPTTTHTASATTGTSNGGESSSHAVSTTLNPRLVFAFETESTLYKDSSYSSSSHTSPAAAAAAAVADSGNMTSIWIPETFIAVTVEVTEGRTASEKTTRLLFQEINCIPPPSSSQPSPSLPPVIDSGEASPATPRLAIDTGIQDRIDPQALTSSSAYASLVKRFASIIEYSRPSG